MLNSPRWRSSTGGKIITACLLSSFPPLLKNPFRILDCRLETEKNVWRRSLRKTSEPKWFAVQGMLCCVFAIFIFFSFLFFLKTLALPNLFHFTLKKIYLCWLNDKWEQKKKAAAHKNSIWKHFLEIKSMQCKKGSFSGMVWHWSYYFNLFL